MEGSDRRQGREQRKRNRSRSRHRSKSRSLSRSRSREGHKRKASHRGEKSRDRSRSYDRSSRRSSDRGRNHRSRRSFSRDNHSDRRNRRSSSRKRNKERDDSKIRDDLSPLGLRPVTLKDIISANPGISMPDAVNKLNTYNSAVARGEVPPPLTAQASVGSALIPIVGEGGNVTKAQREVYVGNLPPGIAVPQLAEFLNSAMKQIGLGKDNNSVVTAWISSDAHYAFVEFRTVEEANAALNTLNGIQVGNYSLKFGRTKSYSGTTTFEANLSSSQLSNLNSLASGLLHSVSSAAPAGVAAFSALSAEPLSDVVMVTNLSTVLDEQQIKDLFTPFGELKAFNVIKATGSNGQSAVFEYYQGSIADIVVAGMNNLDVVGQRISAQKVPLSSASVLLKPSKLNAGGDPVITENEIQAKEDEEANVSKVLCLNNMVDLVDLADDDLYCELIEDVADECNKYGKVLSVIIPRKKGLNSEGDSAVGKIFVELSDVETAKSVQKAVSGRKFNGNLVEAVFFSEDLFRKQLLFSPSGLSKVDHDLD